MSEKLDKLDKFIPRPDGTATKRHMVALDQETYAYITELAEKLETTRNRIITALVEAHRAE